MPVSYARPLHVFDANVRGALMVMNAAQESGVEGILQISSAEIYGDLTGSITEDDYARPHSTYGATKSVIDAIVQIRWREVKCPAIAIRQFNVLGERDVLHPYVVPEIYKQLKESDRVFLEKGKFGKVYNLGSEEGIKIYDLAKIIGILMGKEICVVEDKRRKRKWEVWHLKSDNSKIYGVVEARPEVCLEEAVKRTIDYYEKNGDKWAF